MITSFILGTPGRAGICFRIGSHHSRLSMTNLSDTFPIHSPWFLFVMSIICWNISTVKGNIKTLLLIDIIHENQADGNKQSDMDFQLTD